MEKDPNSRPNPNQDRPNQDRPDQSNKSQGSDLPGTSKDPTERVISDKSSQRRNGQDQDSDRGGPSYRDPNSDSQKRS